jgi:hypothetical protein
MCATVPTGMRDDGDNLAVLLRMAWILLHFFMDFFEQNTLNTLNMLCFCHPQFFLLSEQLMTCCCYPCNVVHFSAIPCNLCLVEQQSSPFVQ